MANNSTASAGFLRFNKGPPKVRLTGDDDEPDPDFYDHLIEEGFDVEYLPHAGGGKAYRERVKNLADDLELGENYAVIGTCLLTQHPSAGSADEGCTVAFGDAAAECLDLHIKPQPHLAALIAYYPTTIAKPQTKYPPHLHVLCHIAGSQGFAPAFPSYTASGPPFTRTHLHATS